MSEPAVPSRLPAGATTEGDGVMTGHGPVRVAGVGVRPEAQPIATAVAGGASGR